MSNKQYYKQVADNLFCVDELAVRCRNSDAERDRARVSVSPLGATPDREHVTVLWRATPTFRLVQGIPPPPNHPLRKAF